MTVVVKQRVNVTREILEGWAANSDGPVALHLKQTLLPVEGEEGIIFPPTYANLGRKDLGRSGESGYNIDHLSDGTRVAMIDSVGSQANRLEPMFRAAPDGAPDNPVARLVPQITFEMKGGLSISIFEVGHRLGDALVRSTNLASDAKEAFTALEKGDASKLARLAPTSLVFGAWDSRDTYAKVPRIVQSVIRAWDVQELTRSAQYNPPVDYATLDVFSEDEKTKAEGNAKSPLAQRGFVHVPSVSAPGGVVARGPIVREVTVNLIALRRLVCPENSLELRRYILGLSLIAASDHVDGFLRQGCLLTLDPAAPNQWETVGRDGVRTPVKLSEEVLLEFARQSARDFGIGKDRVVTFDKDRAKKDVTDAKDKKAGAKRKTSSGSADGAENEA